MRGVTSNVDTWAGVDGNGLLRAFLVTLRHRPVVLLPIGGVGLCRQQQLRRMRQRAAELARNPRAWRVVGNMSGRSVNGRRTYPDQLFNLEFRRVNQRGTLCAHPRPMQFIVVMIKGQRRLAVRWSLEAPDLLVGLRRGGGKKDGRRRPHTPQLGGGKSDEARETAGVNREA